MANYDPWGQIQPALPISVNISLSEHDPAQESAYWLWLIGYCLSRTESLRHTMWPIKPKVFTLWRFMKKSDEQWSQTEENYPRISNYTWLSHLYEKLYNFNISSFTEENAGKKHTRPEGGKKPQSPIVKLNA